MNKLYIITATALITISAVANARAACNNSATTQGMGGLIEAQNNPPTGDTFVLGVELNRFTNTGAERIGSQQGRIGEIITDGECADFSIEDPPLDTDPTSPIN